MRRIDGPNMAVVISGISPSTVIFEGLNDKLAKKHIGKDDYSLPEDR